MIENIQAIGIHIWVIRDKPETEINGFAIPDQAQKKPHTGRILSVGGKVEDKNAKAEMTAIFNRGAGFVIEVFDTEITVLREDQLLGVW